MATPALFAIEPLLKARVEQVLQAFPGLKVFSAKDLAEVEERNQHTPAVHLVSDGLRPRDKGEKVSFAEPWLTVVVVKNATQKDNAGASRTSASPILAALVEGLLGWQPDPAQLRVKPLATLPAPRPGFTANHGYYPLAWEVTHPDTLKPYPVGA